MALTQLIGRALTRRAAASFVRDDCGQVAIIFALALTSLLLFSGVAVDYERASSARSSLQNASDAIVLALGREAASNTPTDTLKQMATARLASMLPSNYAFSVKTVAKTSGTLTMTVEGSIPATITSIAGYKTLKQKVVSQATWGTGKLEIALVLDSTGSMGSYNRMVELKKAANAMLDEMETSEAGLVKIAIVPFDVNVRVANSYKTATWFKTDWWVSWFWNGCIADRDQSNDVSDATVTTSAATKYPGALCSSDKLTTIQPLTDDFTTLHNKINALTPAGNTNITIGLAWGIAILSSQEPFTEGVAPGTKDVTKVIVLMTDGDNTENRWTSTASQIDARTALACQSAKDGKIAVYTVRLMEGNATLLQNCASSTDNYYTAENASDLVPVFQAIGEKISKLRLSS
jgi:Flp pilus assembly protein TadG